MVAVQMSKNRALGQHFLRNPGTITKIMDAAKITTGDRVLEIGPGSGNLTVRILERCQSLTAIEIDPRLIVELRRRCAAQPRAHVLTIVQGDALKVKFPVFDIVLGNLPYQISSPFITRLCQHHKQYRCAVLMFQYEFGERYVRHFVEDNMVNSAQFPNTICSYTLGKMNRFTIYIFNACHDASPFYSNSVNFILSDFTSQASKNTSSAFHERANNPITDIAISTCKQHRIIHN